MTAFNKNDWPFGINFMHQKFGVLEWIHKNKDDKDKMKKFLDFRMKMIQEEVDETNAAIKDKNPEEIVDGLIDMCVFAIGTLDAFGVDPHSAWAEVMLANITKEPGVKESRPNPLGLPDLIKPENWEGPDHRGNHGCLSNAL